MSRRCHALTACTGAVTGRHQYRAMWYAVTIPPGDAGIHGIARYFETDADAVEARHKFYGEASDSESESAAAGRRSPGLRSTRTSDSDSSDDASASLDSEDRRVQRASRAASEYVRPPALVRSMIRVATLPASAEWRPVSPLSVTEVFNISGCAWVDSIVLRFLLAGMPALAALSLRGCDRVDDRYSPRSVCHILAKTFESLLPGLRA